MGDCGGVLVSSPRYGNSSQTRPGESTREHTGAENFADNSTSTFADPISVVSQFLNRQSAIINRQSILSVPSAIADGFFGRFSTEESCGRSLERGGLTPLWSVFNRQLAIANRQSPDDPMTQCLNPLSSPPTSSSPSYSRPLSSLSAQ